MSTYETKAPRLYIDSDFLIGKENQLSDDHAHYLLSVMRRSDGDTLRVFNGRHGEFIAKLLKTGKKSANILIEKQIKEQPIQNKTIHLYFAPIKKDRLGFLIEKSVELGVTDLHPVITARTENRKPNSEKIKKQIIEATEQCERLDIPYLHSLINFHDITESSIPLHIAVERSDADIFIPVHNQDIACMIGPEGGWTDEEKAMIENASIFCPTSLGNRILRAETAAIYMLSQIRQ